MFYNYVAALTSKTLYEAIMINHSVFDSSEVGISEKIVQLITIYRAVYEQSKAVSYTHLTLPTILRV